MKGSPGRKLRRQMEAAMIKASRPSIKAAAVQQLAAYAARHQRATKVIETTPAPTVLRSP